MNNADMPAMPVDRETGSDIDAAVSSPKKYGMPTGLGLTKREYFAGLAMQGFASNPNFKGDEEHAAALACDYADELLEELERTK